MPLLQAIMRVRQTFIEKRRSIREHVHFPAWTEIGDGSQRCECTVLDISEDGARIMLSSPTLLPEEFWLVFTKDGTRRRRCRMVWRSDEQVGVIYLGPPQSYGSSAALN
jgi:PilZ domain